MKDIICRLIASAIAGIGVSVVSLIVIGGIAYVGAALENFLRSHGPETPLQLIAAMAPIALVATVWIFVRLGRE